LDRPVSEGILLANRTTPGSAAIYKRLKEPLAAPTTLNRGAGRSDQIEDQMNGKAGVIRLLPAGGGHVGMPWRILTASVGERTQDSHSRTDRLARVRLADARGEETTRSPPLRCRIRSTTDGALR
jgi:hypothetical protein